CAIAAPYLTAARVSSSSEIASSRSPRSSGAPSSRRLSPSQSSSSSRHGRRSSLARSSAASARSAASSTCSPGSTVKSVKPAARQARTSSAVFWWSASAPTGRRHPAAKAPQVASSTTSWGARRVRVISRIDCCANTGATMPAAPVRSRASAWPGVARPSRSPKPALVARPSGTGRRFGSSARRAAALPGVVPPTSSLRPSPPSATVPSKRSRTGSPGRASTIRAGSSPARSHSAAAPEKRRLRAARSPASPRARSRSARSASERCVFGSASGGTCPPACGPRGEPRSGAAHDELGLEDDVDPVPAAVHAVDEHPPGLLAELVGRRPYRRETGREHAGEDDVVVASHRDLPGHGDAQLLQGLQSAGGDEVVEAQQRVDLGVARQHLARGPGAALDGRRAGEDTGRRQLQAELLVLEARAAQDDAVDEVVLERAQRLRLARDVLDAVGEQQGVTVLDRDVLRAPDDLGEVGVRDVGDDQPDRARGGGAQAARDDVRAVAEALDRLPDPLAGPLAHARPLVDDPRHGHDRDAGPSGDVGQRDPLGRGPPVHPYLLATEATARRCSR